MTDYSRLDEITLRKMVSYLVFGGFLSRCRLFTCVIDLKILPYANSNQNDHAST